MKIPKRLFPLLYPFLFAAATVLFYYRVNFQEVNLSFLPQPLLMVLFITVAILGISSIFVKDRLTKGLVVFLLVAVMLSFGHLFNLIQSVYTSTEQQYVLVAIVSVFVALSLIGLIISHDPIRRPLHLVLATFSVYFFLSESFLVTRLEVLAAQIRDSVASELPEVTKPDELPDVYYLVFDRYANGEVLRNLYRYDNEPFLQSLESRGFYVARNSVVNYNNTPQSLASSLNMEYLDTLRARAQGIERNPRGLATFLNGNKVKTIFKQLGYSYYYVGARWGFSRVIKADENLTLRGEQETSFAIRLPSRYRIPLHLFTLGYLEDSTILHGVIEARPASDSHRDFTLYQLATIGDLAQSRPGPRFVFGHILLPHDPYIFRADCSDMSFEETLRRPHLENYLDQLECTNKKMTSLVDAIMERSSVPPIIIIQSDEGPTPMMEDLEEQGWGDTALYEKFFNLTAVYFPNQKYEQLSQTITPVNIFRVVLNTYFGTDLPLLPERNYLLDNQYTPGVYASFDQEKFIDVTDRVRTLLEQPIAFDQFPEA
jgi:hypothetical protein